MKKAQLTFAVLLLGAALAHADDARQHALSILEASPVIDGHNDLPWVLRNAADGNVELAVIENPSSIDTDIERLREGRVGSQFWSVYVPSSLEPDESVRVQLEQIDLVRRMIDANPDAFGLALSADD
ncbi:MAG: membrane dipeptidase, partial [Woeseiaceae bacterium]|nr:membrane dipeptidase [Woeseiaceae bacterium]